MINLKFLKIDKVSASKITYKENMRRILFVRVFRTVAKLNILMEKGLNFHESWPWTFFKNGTILLTFSKKIIIFWEVQQDKGPPVVIGSTALALELMNSYISINIEFICSLKVNKMILLKGVKGVKGVKPAQR